MSHLLPAAMFFPIKLGERSFKNCHMMSKKCDKLLQKEIQKNCEYREGMPKGTPVNCQHRKATTKDNFVRNK